MIAAEGLILLAHLLELGLELLDAAVLTVPVGALRGAVLSTATLFLTLVEVFFNFFPVVLSVALSATSRILQVT